MREEMSFELAGGPYAVTAARLALSDLDARLDPSVAFDVRLLVSKLVTNSVKHANVSEDDSIMLDLKIKGESRTSMRTISPLIFRSSMIESSSLTLACFTLLVTSW